MKKNYALFIVPIIAVVFVLMSYSSGSPGSKTGSPGDGGSTCTDCHTGTANPVNDWITTNIPMTGYVPGNTYTITLTGTHTGVVKFGFEVTAENAGGSKVGTFIITDAVQTQLKNGTSVTHTSNGNTPSGNSKTWMVDWTAPAAGTGNVGIYAAFNAANGNGGTSGDVIYKTSTIVLEAANPEIAGIAPDNGDQGEMIAATISGDGTSWSGTPSVSLSFSGNPAEVINGTGISVTNGTTIQANFNIPSNASAGLWDVHVDALSLDNGFTVNEIILSILSMNPGLATQGDMFTGTISGQNTSWTGSTPVVSLAFHNNPSELINGTDVNVISNTQLEADFDIPLDASPGSYDIHVNALVKDNGFTVNELIMTLTSIVPDSALQGDMLTTTISGNNTFWTMGSPDVMLSNSLNSSETIEASSVTVISDTELQANFSIPNDASVGMWDVHADMIVLEEAFEVHLLTGLGELSFTNLEVYPNPTEGLFKLNISESAQLDIIDIRGNRVQSRRVVSGSNTIDLSSVPAGIYILNIIGERKAERIKLIVK